MEELKADYRQPADLSKDLRNVFPLLASNAAAVLIMKNPIVGQTVVIITRSLQEEISEMDLGQETTRQILEGFRSHRQHL